MLGVGGEKGQKQWSQGLSTGPGLLQSAGDAFFALTQPGRSCPVQKEVSLTSWIYSSFGRDGKDPQGEFS